MAVWPQIISTPLMFLLLCSALLATTLHGAQGEVEVEGPSESECRPYIEKALKKLETGDTLSAAVQEDTPTEAIDESIDDSGNKSGDEIEIVDADTAGVNEQTQNASVEDEQIDTQESVEETKDSVESETIAADEETGDNVEENDGDMTDMKSESANAQIEGDEDKKLEEDTTETNAETEQEETEDDTNENKISAEDDNEREHVTEEATEEGVSNEKGEAETEDSSENAVVDEASTEQQGSVEQEIDTKESLEQDVSVEQETNAEQKASAEKQDTAEQDDTAEQNDTVEEETSTEQEVNDELLQSTEQAVSAEQNADTEEEADAKNTAETEDEASVEKQVSVENTSAEKESNDNDDENIINNEVGASTETEDNANLKEAIVDEQASTEKEDSVNTEASTEQEESTNTEASIEQESTNTEEQQVSNEQEQTADTSDDNEKKSQEQSSTEADKEESDTEGEKQSEENMQADEIKSAENDDVKSAENDDVKSAEEPAADSAEGEQEKENAEDGEKQKGNPDGVEKEKEDTSDGEQENASTADGEQEKENTDEESTEGETEEEKESTPEEDLSWEFDIPTDLRPRDHIAEILQINDETTGTENMLIKAADVTLNELKRLYENAIKPLEVVYKYRDLSNRHFGDPEIFSKPLILFMGPWSGGKSSIINYLLDNEFKQTSLRTGAEPSPAYFNILMHGDEPEVLDGTQLAADWTFSGLQKFGQGLEERLRGLKYPSKLLEKINIVEIPGILEVRKQVSRVFPFNDACQWFIDRADIIFLVYDPSKLDVGPETEAILDQLKGREYQTRIILNKADQVKPEELMRVQGALIWNISPLMSSAQPPVMYTTSLWSKPYEVGAPVRLLQAQEKAFLKDLKTAVDKRIENKIASARRFAVRVRNHAKMVDCYLTTYYNHKSVFGNKKLVADQIIEHPQNYHIYEGLSTLTNISRYDLPDPDVYRDFFKLNPLYDFQQLSATCTYFRGCPINRLDVAIAYDLPELVGKYKKLVDAAVASSPESTTKS